MVRLVRLPLLLLSTALVLSSGRAQTATPDPEAGPPSPAPVRPRHDRAISSSLATTLAASMPKYNPPPKPKPEDADVDLREVDKPRNGIIRLPKYTVREKRPPVFRERDIYTSGGLAELAKRRYMTPGYRLLNSFYIPFVTSSPEQLAMALYAEDERLNNISDLKDTARDIGKADPQAATYLRRQTDETYMRTSGFGGYNREP
jgi:hypothetical protein